MNRRVLTAALAVLIGGCITAALPTATTKPASSMRPTSGPAGDGLISASAPHPAGTLAVRWTAAVPMAAGDWPNVARLLDRAVDIHTTEAMELVTGNDVRSPSTGTAYLELVEAGYSYKTNYDNMKESYFKAATVPVVWLAECKPAKRSYVRDIGPGVDPRGTLAQLPAAFGLDLVGNRDDEPWLVVWPKSAVEACNGGWAIAIDDGEHGRTVVELLGWGDHDGDGAEDCLLSVSGHVTDGTYKRYSYVTVTRRKPGSPLIVLSQED